MTTSHAVFCTWTHRTGLSPSLRGKFGDLDQLIRQLVSSARTTLTVAAPYLSPAGMRGLKNAIGVAVQHGAAIRLVTSDLDGEGQRNRHAVRELVAGADGNRIRCRLRVLSATEALPSLLHAKVVIADRERGYLGSANFSWRGMESNLEIGVPLDRQQAEAVDDMISYLEAKSLLHEVSP